MRDAHRCSGPPVSEMTYTVSSGTLNSTIPYHISTTTNIPTLCFSWAGCTCRPTNIAPWFFNRLRRYISFVLTYLLTYLLIITDADKESARSVEMQIHADSEGKVAAVLRRRRG